MTRSQICSLSSVSTALYVARVLRIAILPHSEHSFSATSSLERVGGSMMKRWALGLAEVGGVVGLPSSSTADSGVSDILSDASWMSERAVMALATT